MERVWPWILLAYVCGSAPWGLWIGLWRGVDLRKHGSGNFGATNAVRVLGRKWGGLCFALDVAKGFGPVLGAGLALGYVGRADLGAIEAWSWLAVGLAAMLGHIFPVWLRFRGGKGVATGLGVLLGFWPVLSLPGLAALATWLAAAWAWRYVSLASLLAAGVLPAATLGVGLWGGRRIGELLPFLCVTVAMSALVVVRHRGNIARLRAGTESRIGQKVSTQGTPTAPAAQDAQAGAGTATRPGPALGSAATNSHPGVAP
jgi:glycerol-3-phosphate acyltransferase PlsY